MFDKLIAVFQQFGHALSPVFVVDMWEKALVLRFGKFNDIKDPGLHWKIPFADSVWHQTIVTQSIHLHPQSITSLDYKNIVVRAIVRYDIKDCYLFLTKLAHPTDVLVDTTGAMIREIIEERNWEDLVDIEIELTEKIGKKVSEWGINIEKVTLTDLAEIDSLRVISDGDNNRQSIVPLTDTTNN
jgi:regulator of protease activity HflC (stomatin/prohibitin superfamily)